MTTDALAIVFSPNLLRAPHNDFLMIMSNMQHTNKLVKALVTHVRVLEFAASTNRSFIDYSSTLSSTRRKRKRIKSTMTTNLTNPFSRRMKRLKQRTRAMQRNDISLSLRDLVLSTLLTKSLPNSPLKYFIRFISRPLAPRHFRAACCTFIAISVTQFFHYISGLYIHTGMALDFRYRHLSCYFLSVFCSRNLASSARRRRPSRSISAVMFSWHSVSVSE